VDSGLKQLHSNNIVHRDLKPSNVFIQGDGTFRVGMSWILILSDKFQVILEQPEC
jgi:serine/threonine protein kinase